MQKDEINTLYSLYDKFEKEVNYAFDKLSKENLLEFSANAINNLFLDINYPNLVSINYYDEYDSSDTRVITIPTDILDNESSLSNYIQKLKKEKEEKERIEKEKKEKLKEDYERKEYERLKQKYKNLA